MQKLGKTANVVAVITARLGSSRLPGKVLADLGGQSLLAHVIGSVRQAKGVDAIVVATTQKPEDELLAASALELGVEVFRGSEEDVLERFYLAAKAFGAEVVVRLTVDNPLLPAELVDQVVERHLATAADYTCNFLPPSFPDGFEVEVLSMAVLDQLHRNAKKPEEREHVTWYIRTHPEEFHIENVAAEVDRSDLLLSVDTPDDLERVRLAYEEHQNDAVSAGDFKSEDDLPEPIGLCVPLSAVFERNRAEVLPLVDAVSFKEPDAAAFPGKACFLESSLNLCDPDFPEKIAPLMPVLAGGKYTSFSCDLGPCCANWKIGKSPNDMPRYLPAGKVMEEEELRQNLLANTNFVRRHFSAAIKVENLNYFPTGAYELVCEPAFINQLLDEAGLELLLDLAHALISAHNLGWEPEKYLAQLPLQNVTEVHLSRAGKIDGIWEDTHECPGAREFELLDFIKARAPLQFLTLEYYRQDKIFVAGYRELHRWIAASRGEIAPLPIHV